MSFKSTFTKMIFASSLLIVLGLTHQRAMAHDCNGVATHWNTPSNCLTVNACQPRCCYYRVPNCPPTCQTVCRTVYRPVCRCTTCCRPVSSHQLAAACCPPCGHSFYRGRRGLLR